MLCAVSGWLMVAISSGRFVWFQHLDGVSVPACLTRRRVGPGVGRYVSQLTDDRIDRPFQSADGRDWRGLLRRQVDVRSGRFGSGCRDGDVVGSGVGLDHGRREVGHEDDAEGAVRDSQAAERVTLSS
jgi:hypothetical protein